MASITKKPNGTWLAQVRRAARDGAPAVNKSASFPRKSEAQAWAEKTEAEWRAFRAGITPAVPFADVLKRYLNEITPTKRGYKTESYRIARLLKTPLAQVRLDRLSDAQLKQWADTRLQQVSADSVIREWATLSHVLTVCVKKWRLLPENYMKRLEKPKKSPPRTRRISADEIAKIRLASGYNDYTLPEKHIQRVGAAFLFAIETAMRAGEICTLSREHLHLEQGYAHLTHTKNGEARDVPLSPVAQHIAQQVMAAHSRDTVFGLRPDVLDAQFRRIKQYALIDDLHFHDTRREALTRLAEVYTVMELAKVSGHKDLRVLLNTYYAPQASELAQKLASR